MNEDMTDWLMLQLSLGWDHLRDWIPGLQRRGRRRGVPYMDDEQVGI